MFANFALISLWSKNKETYSENLSNILKFQQLRKCWSQDLNSGLSDSPIHAFK